MSEGPIRVKQASEDLPGHLQVAARDVLANPQDISLVARRAQVTTRPPRFSVARIMMARTLATLAVAVRRREENITVIGYWCRPPGRKLRRSTPPSGADAMLNSGGEHGDAAI